MKIARQPNTAADTVEIPLQTASYDIWERKYQLRSKDGNPVDQTIEDTWSRIAKALSETETTPE